MLSRRSNFSAQDFIYLFNYLQSSSEAVLDSGHITCSLVFFTLGWYIYGGIWRIILSCSVSERRSALHENQIVGEIASGFSLLL
jgi:uncharacterized membrane protein YciS (DUF1049 family)